MKTYSTLKPNKPLAFRLAKKAFQAARSSKTYVAEHWREKTPIRLQQLLDSLREQDDEAPNTRVAEPNNKASDAPISSPDDACNENNDANWSELSVDEIRDRMDERFADGSAYPMNIAWDIARAEELNAIITDFAHQYGEPQKARALDIGCGEGGIAGSIDYFDTYVGIELSDVAVKNARNTYAHLANYEFKQMDATELDFPSDHFDLAFAREVLEHLPEAKQCVAETFRVLKPGAKFLLSSPNRDSLHLRMNRILGYQDFKCSIDHVHEFSFDEMSSLLKEIGFRIIDNGGVFLMPYWGIPDIDQHVRQLTDHNEEVIEIFRQLGRRANSDYAFCFVIVAEKPA